MLIKINEMRVEVMEPIRIEPLEKILNSAIDDESRLPRYLYGPVPSRRLGLSLGISPIPKKTCNYSCIYCQLGRTDHLTNTRQMFFPVEDIVRELDQFLKSPVAFDVVTIVGEGEPTLYLGLGHLIRLIRLRTEKPIAIITNGALLYDRDVQDELMAADIVLPSLDAVDEDQFRRIHRPHRRLTFSQVFQGLVEFSHRTTGRLWLEVMLMAGVNDDDETLNRLKSMLDMVRYDRLYLNTPVRPPAEPWVRPLEHEQMERAVDRLGGISIDLLASEGFYSAIADPVDAIKSIIKRHPMNQYEISDFLSARGFENPDEVLARLNQDEAIVVIDYKGYHTYRLK